VTIPIDGPDNWTVGELDREFHLAIVQRARLTTLEPILTRCALHVHRYAFGNGPVSATPDHRVGLPSSMEQHRTVGDALATRDPECGLRMSLGQKFSQKAHSCPMLKLLPARSLPLTR
jgi:hypothetical protein